PIRANASIYFEPERGRKVIAAIRHSREHALGHAARLSVQGFADLAGSATPPSAMRPHEASAAIESPPRGRAPPPAPRPAEPAALPEAGLRGRPLERARACDDRGLAELARQGPAAGGAAGLGQEPSRRHLGAARRGLDLAARRARRRGPRPWESARPPLDRG